jgi:hypothetical protein
MHSSAILREARQLHSVGDRHDSLAGTTSSRSEALITSSGNIRHTEALLEALVATKMRLPSAARLSRWLICVSFTEMGL